MNQTMTNHPTISVVMTVYNGGRYLDEAVESICRQTFADFEFLIVNDGSTDHTADVLSRHAEKDPRIRVITQPNRGLVAALNAGCAAARGEWIARMDADDVSLPDRFEKQMNFLRAHPEIGVLGGASQFIENGELVDMYERPPLQHRDILDVFARGNPVVHPSMVIKRAAFEAVGGYRPLFVAAEDVDLWLRLAERCELANLEDIVIHRRRHSEEASFRRVAQTSLLALAARHSARIRRRMGRDPLTTLTVISPRTLMSVGVAAAEIEAELLHSPPYRANLLINRRECDLARRILDDIDRFLRDIPSSRRARSWVAMIRSKSYRVEGRFLPRLFWAAWASLLNPCLVLEYARTGSFAKYDGMPPEIQANASPTQAR
jgi:hypothetical protein